MSMCYHCWLLCHLQGIKLRTEFVDLTGLSKLDQSATLATHAMSHNTKGQEGLNHISWSLGMPACAARTAAARERLSKKRQTTNRGCGVAATILPEPGEPYVAAVARFTYKSSSAGTSDAGAAAGRGLSGASWRRIKQCGLKWVWYSKDYVGPTSIKQGGQQ